MDKENGVAKVNEMNGKLLMEIKKRDLRRCVK